MHTTMMTSATGSTAVARPARMPGNHHRLERSASRQPSASGIARHSEELIEKTMEPGTGRKPGWPGGLLVTLGVAPRQADLFRTTAAYCDGRVAPDSIIDGTLEHSPAEHVRRPPVPAESPTLGFTHLQFEALLTAARQSPCTASELGAGFRNCGLAGPAG
jgi:hypothetical protein